MTAFEEETDAALKIERLERFIGDLGLRIVFTLWFDASDEERIRLITKVAPRAIRPVPMLHEISKWRTAAERYRELQRDCEIASMLVQKQSREGRRE